MKNRLYILAIVLVSSVAVAQTTTENYVKTVTPQVPVQTQTQLGNLTADQKIESITYIDGLGRPMQSIARQAGGNRQDIITPIVYDAYGRQPLEYLPYARSASSLNYKASLVPNINGDIVLLNTQYLSKYGADLDTNAPNPYSEKVFEASPLNRVLEQGAPGKDWAITNGNTIKFDYQTNTFDPLNPDNPTNDNIILYRVIFPFVSTEQPQLYFDGYYNANELYKTIIKDENWQASEGKDHTTEEFKDKQGRVILKRTYTNEVAHDTQYVYDNYGNLTYVLSPKGSDLILSSNKYKNFTDVIPAKYFVPTDKYGPITGSTGNATVSVNTNNSLNELTVNLSLSFNTAIDIENGPIFQLSYTLPNMIIGTFGGYTVSIQDGYLFMAGSGNVTSVQEIFIVTLPAYSVATQEIDDLCYQYHYDKRNRLIEKKIPQKGWEYIVYDNLDRPVLTQDAKLGASNYWLITKYDDFDRVIFTGKYLNSNDRVALQNTLNNQTILNESPSTTPSIIDGADVYYTNNVFPTSSIIEWQTINYYDTYTPDISSVFPNPGTVYGVSTSLVTKSLPTGSRVRTLGSGGWTTTATYYDEKARPIYIGSDNMFLGTKDIIETNLDFLGKPIEVKSTHIKAGVTTIITDNFTYDHTGRLLTQKQQIGTSAQELIVSNAYDELGQLKSKDVGGIEASPLQTVDYTYNIRGWLKTINDVEALGNDLFSFKLNYNTTEIGSTNATALYNGNISETIWKTANDDKNNEGRVYAYAYDDLNRIKVAKYGIKDKGIFDFSFGYHVPKILYDKNGNIVALLREDANLEIDNLSYAYNGNQLTKVDDSSSSQEGFIDGNTVGDDYVYDTNGNMTQDKNKDITEIGYNYLNLPEFIEFNNDPNKTISYFYDATGIKLMKVVNNLGAITTTKYAGNFIYEDTGSGDVLKFFNHPEGYVEPTNTGGYQYVYQYKDHLGNIRLSYSDSDGDGSIDSATEIIEENNYYPFGLKHKGYNNVINGTHHPYGYGGKEENDELGLQWLDFGARNYDASLGRWMNIDPLAEDYYSYSTYNYTMNNPVYFIDPDGRGIWEPDGNGGWIAQDGDSAWTLSQDAGISPEKANKIVESQLRPNYKRKSDGMLMSNVEVGDKVVIETDEQAIDRLTGQGGEGNIESDVLDMSGDGSLDSYIQDNGLVITPEQDNPLILEANSSLKTGSNDLLIDSNGNNTIGKTVVQTGGNQILKFILGKGGGSLLSTQGLNTNEASQLREVRRRGRLQAAGIDPNSTDRQIDSMTLLKIKKQSKSVSIPRNNNFKN